MKRLIVCLDGTWNTPDDKQNATNVVKIMRAIPYTAPGGIKQITFYDKGVGTGGFCDKIVGGMFGTGLEENVKDGYRFLANNYEAGDEIYIFGFSRGAYTARSLAGFIGLCGLLKKTTMRQLPVAWELYATPPEKRDSGQLADIHAEARADVDIECVGVWDTVGARGIPLSSLRKIAGIWKLFRSKTYGFHDMTLSPRVKCALHAIAIDEKRGPFGPTLWESETGPAAGQIVEQVWFPGVHSNIGGSYDDKGLSDLALRWMIQRVAEHTSMEFDPRYISRDIEGDGLATLYESRTALYAFSRLVPYCRVIGGKGSWVPGIARRLSRVNSPKPGHAFVNEMLHRSARDRCGKTAKYQSGKKRSERLYQPSNLVAVGTSLPLVEYDGTISQTSGVQEPPRDG